MPDIMSAISALYEQRMSDLSARLTSGEISLGTWQITMRKEIRDSFALQLRAGFDGDATVTDYLRLGNVIKAQDKYLEAFAHQIKAGQVSDGAIATRAKMYARASGQMFWDGRTGDTVLPAYPKDFSTPCRHNCDCSWRKNGDGSFTWVLGTKDHCDICPRRAVAWNPFDPTAPRDSSLFREAA